MLVIVASLQAKPLARHNRMGRRRSCGRDLWQRVNELCQTRGGSYGYTLPRRRRVRRGIVNECCESECSDYHLISYCSSRHETVANESELPADAAVKSTRDTDSNKAKIAPGALVMLSHTLDDENSIESQETPAPATTTTTVRSTTESIPINLMDGFTVDPPNARLDSRTWYKIYMMLKESRPKDFEVGTVPPEYKSQPFLPSHYQFGN